MFRENKYLTLKEMLSFFSVQKGILYKIFFYKLSSAGRVSAGPVHGGGWGRRPVSGNGASEVRGRIGSRHSARAAPDKDKLRTSRNL